MVLLAMTTSMVEALEKLQSLQEKTGGSDNLESHSAVETSQSNQKSLGIDEGTLEYRSVATCMGNKQPTEPSLLNPKVGNPISHGQVIDISRDLHAHQIQPRSSLETLLRGSKVYVPPPPPKAEPVSDILHNVWLNH
jgi:hypothetical protein